MSAVFLKLVNMSISAGWLILVVIVLRQIMAKAPKSFRVFLWGLAALRLIIPVFPKSRISLVPSSETIPSDIALQQTPQIHSGISILNSSVNPLIGESFAPSPVNSANPLQIWQAVLTAVWIAGTAVMLAYALLSYLRLRRQVSVFICEGQDVRICDDISSPFILGILRPRVYIPSTVSGVQKAHILAHERAHLARRDYLWKPLAYLLLIVYWFNPLVWIAYILLCKDIELACDEKVTRDMQIEDRKAYSETLLACSSEQHRRIAACPLAFGESDVKTRVRFVIRYKKPAAWLVCIAVLLCLLAAVTFLTDPARSAGMNTIANSPYGSGNSQGNAGETVYALPEGIGRELVKGEGVPLQPRVLDSVRPEDDLIMEAIWLHNGEIYSSVMHRTLQSHYTFGKEYLDSDGDGVDDIYRAYIWYLYENYKVSPDGVEAMSGASGPAVMTFRIPYMQIETDDKQGPIIDYYGYWQLLSYRIPRDGSYYTDDVRALFPGYISTQILGEESIKQMLTGGTPTHVEKTQRDVKQQVEWLKANYMTLFKAFEDHTESLYTISVPEDFEQSADGSWHLAGDDTVRLEITRYAGQSLGSIFGELRSSEPEPTSSVAPGLLFKDENGDAIDPRTPANEVSGNIITGSKSFNKITQHVYLQQTAGDTWMLRWQYPQDEELNWEPVFLQICESFTVRQ